MFSKHAFLITFVTFAFVFCNTEVFPNTVDCGNSRGTRPKVASRYKTVKPQNLSLNQSHYVKVQAANPNQSTSNSVAPKEIYQNHIDGEWTYVVGQIGFFHEFEEIGKTFVSIIGIGTYDEGNGVYSTEDWNREAFWFEVDDGAPMHLAAEFYGEFEDTENPNSTIYVYYSYNLLYRQNGIDYSLTEFNGDWIDFELITDPDNNYIDHNIYIYDENGELIDERKFEIGDQVQSNTAMFDIDDPETIWVATMDEEFRTVQKTPVFSYEHLTPNVDFPNETTKGLIDFSTVDLQLILLGVNEENTEGLFNYSNNPLQFSSVIDMGLKWDDEPTTSVMDWFYHFFE